MPQSRQPTELPPLAVSLRALRKLLGLTQDQVAERAGFIRTKVVELEGGRNKATSARIREGLARAFGVSLDLMTRFVEGELGEGEEAAERLLSASREEVEPRQPVSLPETFEEFARAAGFDPDDPEVLELLGTQFQGLRSARQGVEFAVAELRRRKAAEKGKALGVREVTEDEEGLPGPRGRGRRK